MSYEYPTRVTRQRRFQRWALGAGIAVVFVLAAAAFNAVTNAVREPASEETSRTARPFFTAPTPSADADPNVPVKGSFSARVADVESGDTLTVTDVAGKKYRVHLTGVSAPIAGQKFSSESRINLSKLSLNKPVTVMVLRTDLSGAVSARVVQNGTDLGLEQLKQGFALLDKVEVAMQTDDVRSSYTAAEESARRSGIGFWSDTAVSSTTAITQPLAQPAVDVARFAAPVPPGEVAVNPAASAAVQPLRAIPSAPPTQAEVSEPPAVRPTSTNVDSPAASKPWAATTAPPTQEAKAAEVEKPAANPTAVQEALAGKKYILGPRGGCYYLADSGKKVYVAHERCQ